MKASKKLGNRKVEATQGNVTLTPIEDSLALQFALHYELRGRSAGALVLGQGLDKLKFVFGFECKGIHSTLKQTQQVSIFDALESGLKDIPTGETLTIHFGSFTNEGDRQREINQVLQGTTSDPLKFLLYSEKQRLQELTQLGVRKPKFLKLYVTYTVDPQLAGAKDPMDKLSQRFDALWNSFTGQAAEKQQLHYEALFTKAFTDGFQIWAQLLGNKMGLDVTPMSESDLWAEVWQRFNTTPVPPLPQCLHLSERGLEERIDSDIHPTSLLLSQQTAIPTADRTWVHVKGNYVGVLTFEGKPAGWVNKNAQLRYLWDVISRDVVTDTEIVCELSRANEALVKTAMQRVMKQSIVSADMASSKQSVDVAANIKLKKTIAAQEELYEGAVPLNVGVVILVHRPSLDRLEEACRYLESCIRRPAWIDREREYAWKLWTQTLPITWDKLLSKPWDRRMTLLTKEAPGFTPLVTPRSVDRKGFELLSEKGGSPIYLDPYSQHKNMLFLATTRAGKSVMVSHFLTHSLARDIPCVILDFPTDTASTFKDFTRFLGPEMASYFDVGTESNNLFEIPDLRALDLKKQQDRMQDYISFLESALLMMILGGANNQTADIMILRKTIRALVSLLLKRFFDDPTIQTRYQRAMLSGFGSADWLNMPTLRDFVQFCTLDQIEVSAEALGETARAMEHIKLQLQFWVDSRVGRAISTPSSIRTNAKLMVFALRNLSEDDDAAILSLSAYSVAYRNALRSPESIFFIDESPILFGFPDIAELVARLCANGAKAGIRVWISAQDPDTIARSAPASKILQNVSTRLVGRIQPTAVASFVKFFNYPEEIIGRNATESFYPKAAGVYSQWLLDERDTFTYCRYFVPYMQLGSVANNPHEQRARDAFMATSNNFFEAIAKFSWALVTALRNGSPIAVPIVPVAVEPSVPTSPIPETIPATASTYADAPLPSVTATATPIPVVVSPEVTTEVTVEPALTEIAPLQPDTAIALEQVLAIAPMTATAVMVAPSRPDTTTEDLESAIAPADIPTTPLPNCPELAAAQGEIGTAEMAPLEVEAEIGVGEEIGAGEVAPLVADAEIGAGEAIEATAIAGEDEIPSVVPGASVVSLAIAAAPVPPTPTAVLDAIFARFAARTALAMPPLPVQPIEVIGLDVAVLPSPLPSPSSFVAQPTTVA